MYLVITIDVEEDNWGSFNHSQYTTKNIERIHQLQQLFDEYNIRPTYLLSYPVATDEKAISLFKEMIHNGKCEIGAHPHPWNTPPIEEVRNERNSMLCNLPDDLQYKKIATLHDAIRNNFDIQPISFRSGRGGFSDSVAQNIDKLGYKIDTSITAYTDHRYTYGPNYSDCSPIPYRFSVEDIYRPVSNGGILEIPATAGFLQQFNNINVKLNKVISMNPFRTLKFGGIFRRLGILNRVLLSPEASDYKVMIKLTKNLLKEGQMLFNMFFHSPALLAGISPYTKTIEDEKNLFRNIEGYLEFVNKNKFESITLSDALKIFYSR